MSKKTGSDLTIILPCAGNGRRMKSHGSKSLIHISGDECLIQRQIRIIRSQYPKAEIIVTVGFQAEKVIKHLPKFVKTVENELFEETTSVRSACLALRAASNDKFLIINGDLLFNQEAITIKTSASCIILDASGSIGGEKVGISKINEQVSFFDYGLDKKWSQIAFFKTKEAELFHDLCCDEKKKRIYMFEVFNEMIHRGAQIKCCESKQAQVIEIDSLKDIERAHEHIGI